MEEREWKKEKTGSKTLILYMYINWKGRIHTNTHTRTIHQRTVLPLPFSSLSIILSKWVGERGCGRYSTQNNINIYHKPSNTGYTHAKQHKLHFTTTVIVTREDVKN